jgi:thiol-disulfide isomerase/thioredoxin
MRRSATALIAALLLTGCTSPAGNPAPDVTGAFAGCDGIATGPAVTGDDAMPEIQLPCFDGRSMVYLNRIKGPAVINLWASWCTPCQKELPAFARLAAKPGAPRVIGVIVQDGRSASASLAADLGVSFPNLYDERNLLGGALGQQVLPVTLMIGADGHIAYTYRDVGLTDQTLAALVESHL